MFDKFGEFNSVEELNEAAEGFRNEGDLESLMALAQENGLDPDDAQDYVDGKIDKLATKRTAAMGRVALQKEQGPTRYIAMVETMVATDEEIQIKIMKKGKRLQEIHDITLAVAGKKARRLYEREHKPVAAAGFETDMQVKKLIRSYLSMDKTEFEKYVYDGTEVWSV